MFSGKIYMLFVSLRGSPVIPFYTQDHHHHFFKIVPRSRYAHWTLHLNSLFVYILFFMELCLKDLSHFLGLYTCFPVKSSVLLIFDCLSVSYLSVFVWSMCRWAEAHQQTQAMGSDWGPHRKVWVVREGCPGVQWLSPTNAYIRPQWTCYSCWVSAASMAPGCMTLASSAFSELTSLYHNLRVWIMDIIFFPSNMAIIVHSCPCVVKQLNRWINILHSFKQFSFIKIC